MRKEIEKLINEILDSKEWDLDIMRSFVRKFLSLQKEGTVAFLMRKYSGHGFLLRHEVEEFLDSETPVLAEDALVETFCPNCQNHRDRQIQLGERLHCLRCSYFPLQVIKIYRGKNAKN